MIETTSRSPAALVEAFLAAHTEPAGMYDLLAPGALLIHDRKVKQREDVTLKDLVSYFEKETQDWEVGGPGSKASAPAEPGPMVSYREEAGGKAVACFDVKAGRERVPAFAIAGFEQVDGAWKLSWITLDTLPREWSWALGRAQMLGNQGLCKPASLARTFADLAAFRHWDHPQPQILTLPESHFSCHGSGLCCYHEWGIEVAEEAQDLLDIIPWEDIAPQYKGIKLPPAKEPGMLQLKDRHATCRFLDEQKHCGMHKALGWQPFRVCAIFPYSFSKTPDGVVAIASQMCPSARKNLGPPVASNLPDLHYRRSMFAAFETDAYRLSREVSLPWEQFKAVETELLELISDPKRPMARRLWMASCRLEALAAGKQEWDPAWETEEIPTQDADDFGATEHMLAKRLPWHSPTLKPLLEKERPRPRHDDLRDETELVAIMRNAIFAKSFSYPYDLTTANNMLTWLYATWLLLEAFHRDQPALPRTMIEVVAQLAFHSRSFHEMADLPGREQTPIGEVVARASHARWLLGYPLPAGT